MIQYRCNVKKYHKLSIYKQELPNKYNPTTGKGKILSVSGKYCIKYEKCNIVLNKFVFKEDIKWGR